MATRSCGIDRDITPTPIPFAYKSPSWHLVVMTTAHSFQCSFRSEIQKASNKHVESLMKSFFFFIMRKLLTLCSHVNPIIILLLQEIRENITSCILYIIGQVNNWSVLQNDCNIQWVWIQNVVLLSKILLFLMPKQFNTYNVSSSWHNVHSSSPQFTSFLQSFM